MSGIEAEHTVNIAETDAESHNSEGEIQFIGSNIRKLYSISQLLSGFT